MYDIERERGRERGGEGETIAHFCSILFHHLLVGLR